MGDDAKQIDRPDPLAFARRMMRLVWWPIVAAPPLLAVGLAYGLLLEPETGAWWKGILENVAVVELAAGLLVAAGRLVATRHLFFGWTTALAGVLLFREFHLIPQATTLTLIALTVLAGIAWHASPRLRDYLETRRVATLLALMVASYATSTILDIDRFKYSGYVLLVVEEVIECTGHTSVLLLAILARPIRAPADR